MTQSRIVRSLHRWLATVEVRPLLLFALLLATFVAVRLVALEADPPAKLPGGVPTRELWAEGAAKAHEARNYALFGRWHTNPADNYQFWRAQAPVWVYSLAAFFKLLGVSIATARLHSVGVAVAGFAVCLWYARKQLSDFGLIALGVFLGCNYFYVQYTRVGLLEPMVNLFAAATVFCCHRTLSSPRWLTAATVSLLLCVFSKMTGLVLLPMLVACAFVGLRRERLPRRELGWLLLPSIALLATAAVFMSSDAYLKRVIWNVAHVAYADEGGTSVDASRIDPIAILERYASGKRWDRLFLLFPVASVLCVPALLHAARDFWRNRTLTWDGLTVVWLLAMHATLQLTPLTDLRFALTLFPPMALLGARGLDLCLSWLRRWPGVAPALAVLTLFVSVGIDAPRQLDWFRKRTYAVRNANQRVVELIGPRADAVIVGLWAPWLTLQTPYKFYVVRDYFNVTKPALARLGITHLLLAPGDRSGKHVQKSFPRQFRSKRSLGSFRVYTQPLTLFELTEPIQ